MPDPRAALLAEARRRHGDGIKPCASRATLEDSFTTLPSGEVVLWYNTPDGSTHILRQAEALPPSLRWPGALRAERK